MKKRIAAIIAAIMIVFSSAGLLAACDGTTPSGKTKIVATVFSEYDWVMNILGDRKSDFDVKLLMDGGADLHSFQPSFDDMSAISECDIFIFVGGESDDWVAKQLKNAVNKDMKVINLLETLGDKAREEEEIEGMQEEEHEEEEETEYDEHVWLSLKNAKIFVKKIADVISSVDNDNAEIYSANASSYIAKLNELDEKYDAMVNASPRDTALFGDRFPFLYLFKDYDINYYAAFKGCSAATEVSFETIAFLKDKINELNIRVILVLESSDEKIAKSIRNETANKDQTIMKIDSLQSATKQEYESGRTYLNIMASNLDVLKRALA